MTHLKWEPGDCSSGAYMKVEVWIHQQWGIYSGHIGCGTHKKWEVVMVVGAPSSSGSSSGRLGTLAGRDWSKKQRSNHPPYRSTHLSSSPLPPTWLKLDATKINRVH